MRKLILLFTVIVLLPLSSVLSQTLDDYISEVRGDSLVIKDDIEYGDFNTLYAVLNADTTDVPEGRVYVLKTFGVYSLANNPVTSEDRKVIIMGENESLLKTNDDPDQAPPVICGAYGEGVDNPGAITTGYQLHLKNVNVAIGNSGGNLNWQFFTMNNPGCRLHIDNCIIEHTLWAVIGGPASDQTLILTNNYFVNLAGHECRRNGGVIDINNGTTQDTILVENNTHVNTQGSLYKSRPGYKINRQIYNHNTFINNSGYVFMNYGGHTDISVTNNIFVNSTVQPFSPVLEGADVDELDAELLPMGLVNVYADSAFIANGATFYVDRNLVYWDPTLDDVVSTVIANETNGTTDWYSQMIKMNTRSQAMFDNDEEYPLLTEGEWIEGKLPNFAETDVLFTDQLQVLKEFSTATVDLTYSGSLELWRQPGNPATENFVYADWPIPIDLSYDDSDLLTAGLNGFPVGDLNWFPEQYAAWEAQRETELEQIHVALYEGVVGVEEQPGLAKSYELSQNYPNPFNPTTVINFTIPQAGEVTLKVYNSIGQEVATLVNGHKAAANYKVDFDASNLSSGVYFYTIKVDNNFTQTKKMVLIK